MKNYFDQHRKWQQQKIHPFVRRFLIIHMPIGFMLIFILIPGWIVRNRWHLPIDLNPILEYLLGGAVFILGFALYLWTIVLFAKAGGTQVPMVAPTQRIVTTGPYAVTRNPMVTSAMFMVFGLGIILDSWSFFLLGQIPFYLYLLYIRFIEEKELEERFGEEYRTYRKSTPFILPQFFRKKPE